MPCSTDCHSIRSQVPRLFAGELPVFNIGTNGGASCAAELAQAVADACAAAGDYSYVVNGRFKGGWITRSYGRPAAGVHAVQMELAQRAYMAESPPWTYDEGPGGAPAPGAEGHSRPHDRLGPGQSGLTSGGV